MKSIKDSFLFMVNILLRENIRGLPKERQRKFLKYKTKTNKLLLFAPIHASFPLQRVKNSLKFKIQQLNAKKTNRTLFKIILLRKAHGICFAIMAKYSLVPLATVGWRFCDGGQVATIVYK
jgi:hypothetical protein